MGNWTAASDDNHSYGPDKRYGTVILSPHFDDAAFSIGGILIGRYLPEPVTIITIFGKTNYANGNFHSDWKSISQMRQMEDMAYADGVGARMEKLEFPEAGVRIAPSFDVLFVENGMDLEPMLIASLQECLHARFAALRPTFVLAPLGLGNHRDHVVVRAAARVPTESSDAKLLYYEDLPYADAMTNDAIREQAATVCASESGSLIFRLGENILQRQIRSLDVYRSQVDSNVREAIGRHFKRCGCGGVRLWGRRIDLKDFLQPERYAMHLEKQTTH